MRGLVKNNFLAVYTNARIFSVFLLLLGIFSAAVTSISVQMYFVIIGIVGFSVSASAVLHNEQGSKWGKYQLTLPVKRTDIVKSLFFNYVLWMLIGVLFAGLETGASWLLHGYPPEQYLDILGMFALGIGISLFMGTIFFPLFYLGGEEKSTVFLMIALLCAVGINALLSNLLDASFTLGVIAILGCSSLAFLLSLPLTVWIFQKKEY